jgi:DNA-binding NarL/FixJ family response regulator
MTDHADELNVLLEIDESLKRLSDDSRLRLLSYFASKFGLFSVSAGHPVHKYPTRMTPEKLEKARHLIKQGMSKRQVATRIGVSYQTLYNHIDKIMNGEDEGESGRQSHAREVS